MSDAVPEQVVALMAAQKALAGQYDNFRYLKEGGHRWLFLADYIELPFGKKTRVIKVDKPPANERAERHVSRGYTTQNDARVLFSLDDAQRHHINMLHGFRDLRQHGWDGFLSIEDHFDAPSLEERVAERPLDAREFREVFTKVLDGMGYLSANGMFHRDVKPSNILVRQDLDVRVTDLSNARKKDDIVTRHQPTVGGHNVTEPALMPPFIAGESRYTERSEVYALGMTMLYALTGSYGVEYDPEAGTAVRLDTGASILTDGKPDFQKHDKAILEFLDASLKGDARRYKHLLWSTLSLNPSQGNGSLEGLIREFKKADAPTFVEQMKRSWRQVAAGIGVVLALGAAGAKVGLDRLAETHAQEVTQASRIPLTPEFDGERMEIGNNLVEMQIEYAYSSTIQRETEGVLAAFPRDAPIVRAGGSDEISLTLTARALPHKDRPFDMLPHFRGRAYIEGYPAQNEFHIRPAPYNRAVLYSIPEASGMGTQWLTVTLPGLPDGMYTLAVELYTPLPEDLARARETAENLVDIAVPERSVIMSRKRIPVMVGNPALRMDVGYVNLDSLGMGGLGMKDPASRYLGLNDRQVTYSVDLPEEGLHETYAPDERRFNGNIPLSLNRKGIDERVRVAAFGARIDGKLIWRGFVPVRRTCEYCMSKERIREELLAQPGAAYSYFTTPPGPKKLEEDVQRKYDEFPRSWKLAIPEADYAERLVELRERYLDPSK